MCNSVEDNFSDNEGNKKFRIELDGKLKVEQDIAYLGSLNVDIQKKKNKEAEDIKELQ